MSPKYRPRENPELYEINTAAWLYYLTQKAGRPVRLGEVPPAEWDRIKDWGMDYVWLMGVWSRSRKSRLITLTDPGFHRLFDTITPGWTPEDVIGSAYSISAYEPDALIGSWDDLDRAREELRRRGMGLILDFIPNHTGMDHHWISQHPEYYVKVDEEDYRKDQEAYFPISSGGKTMYLAHGKDPNFPAWTDTAQLNYFNPETRAALVREIERISRHCDGIRCDMAMLVLNDVFQRIWGWTNKNGDYPNPAEEFWTEVTRQIPHLIYLAEAYWDTEWTLQQLGFDFVYDKRLYDRLKDGHPYDVFLHLTADINYQKKLVRFIENHDETRSAAAFGGGKLEAAAALFATLPGLKLYYFGQMEGRRIRLPVQIRRSRPEDIQGGIQAFYEKLLQIVNEDVFHAGNWRLKEALPDGDNTHRNLLTYTWQRENEMRWVIINLGRETGRGRVVFQDELPEHLRYRLIDRLSGESYEQDGKLLTGPGLSLTMAGYQAQIFEISPIM
jgi:hypothetical protein